MPGRKTCLKEPSLSARSNRKPPILYFGNDWYAENRTSSHHIARWLAKDYSVYYVECPGLRAPQGSSRDIKKIAQKLSRSLRRPVSVPEGLKVKTLFQIPFHRFASVRWLNKRLIAGSIWWLRWREGIKNPITWFTIPHVPSLVGSMGEELSVYYCTDDHGSLTDVNERAVRAMDEETTRRASLVFVTSGTLLEGKRKLNPNVFVSPHGVHVEHFGRAQDERLPVAADVSHLPRPVIGFFGLIEPRIDVELIDYLAEQRPQWTFLLIGRVAIPPHLLPSRSNIHFIGKRPYESLPSYGRIFDATIIPYRQNRFNFHANPLKLREYLAMGKPVISIRTPEIEKYADVVAIADSREEFLSRLDEALSAADPVGEAQRRMSRVTPESWENRLQAVHETVKLFRERHGASIARPTGYSQFASGADRSESPSSSCATSPFTSPARHA
jgi:glycosyltransferase involved in cell wall biosynthesis